MKYYKLNGITHFWVFQLTGDACDLEGEILTPLALFKSA
jgi:hypothetical protein